MSPRSVVELPAVRIPSHRPPPIGDDSHPMRHMTRRIAGLEGREWDQTAAELVVETFDSLAAEWHLRMHVEGVEVVRDALTRGVDAFDRGGRLSVELGSGTGAYSDLIAERYKTSLAVDISGEMLRRAPRFPAHRVLADAGRLPIADKTADAVVLINAFLFPAEVARVLSLDGSIVWVNTLGHDTPIYLSTEDVVAALPFEVTGVESRSGIGTWCVLWRAGREDAPVSAL